MKKMKSNWLQGLTKANVTKNAIAFKTDDKGAVTVDFIVITAVIVMMGTVIVGLTSGGTEKVAIDISSALSAVPVN